MKQPIEQGVGPARALQVLLPSCGELVREHVRDIARWISSKGIQTLVLESGDPSAPPLFAKRRSGEMQELLPLLEGDALRGYLSVYGDHLGSLAVDGELDQQVMQALAQSYALLFGIVWESGDAQRSCGRWMRTAPPFSHAPAVLMVDAHEESSVRAAGRWIERALKDPHLIRPSAFSLIPHDLSLAARLARRWHIPSWGAIEGNAALGERFLERSAIVELKSVSPPSHERQHVHAQLMQELLREMQQDAELTQAIDASTMQRASAGKREVDPELRTHLAGTARRILHTRGSHNLEGSEMEPVIAEVVEQAVGFGPLEPLFADPAVSEIMVCGARRVSVERAGRIEAASVQFADDEHLRAFIDRLLAPIGRRIDEASPAVDARLADGSRLHAIIPPLAVNGPCLTIRRFLKGYASLQEAVAAGMLPASAAEFLCACVRARISLIVAGGTGAGKTTLLGALASEIDPGERIITIEDAAELSIDLPHVVRLESRPPNIEGRGEVTIRDLVRHALRMRPDRIIVGECRGKEALDMLQAMNTGHEGSLTTVHANSPRDVMARLETMVLMAGLDLPQNAIREQIVRALDLIVQVGRIRRGERRVVEIAEVMGLEGQVPIQKTLAVWNEAQGELVATGLAPSFRGRGEDGRVPVLEMQT